MSLPLYKRITFVSWFPKGTDLKLTYLELNHIDSGNELPLHENRTVLPPCVFILKVSYEGTSAKYVWYFTFKRKDD